MNELRIATRQSPLALWQAEYVKSQLQKTHPELIISLVPMVSKGDKILDVTLNKIGGKGLFTKELENALLAGEADIAVHSMKDVPMQFPEGLALSVICAREEPTDAFVSNHYQRFEDLPLGATVGTSSLRRQSQLLAARPDLNIKFLRGNVGTRLGKLDAGDYDAIILASAGLIRLGLNQRIQQALPIELSLPAAGQGAVGIECRADDTQIHALLANLSDHSTTLCVHAERALITQLNGSCQVPIAGFAQLQQQQLTLIARVANADGSELLHVEQQTTLGDDGIVNLQLAQQLGKQVAQALRQQGAQAILDDFLNA